MESILHVIAEKSPDKLEEHYEKYLNCLMPFFSVAVEPDEDKLELLKKWVDRGPISFSKKYTPEDFQTLPKAWAKHLYERVKDGGGNS